MKIPERTGLQIQQEASAVALLFFGAPQAFSLTQPQLSRLTPAEKGHKVSVGTPAFQGSFVPVTLAPNTSL